MFKPCCMVAVACVTLSGTAVADIIHVPGDYRTIQAAIDAAVNGDEILVAPGIYVENIDLLGKIIALRSKEGPDVTTIDGDYERSVIRCVSGETRETTIEGFTITKGIGESGKGGGIYIQNSSPTVLHCVIANNLASDQGGGIWSSGGSPLFKECAITGNAAQGPGSHGGGAWFTGTMIDCLIAGNVSVSDGGGLRCVGLSPLIGCTIRFNSCTISTQGTALVTGDSTSLLDCTICSNWSAQGDDLDILGPFTDKGGNNIALECVGGCEGDLDADDEVNVHDLLTLLANWGPCP